MPPNTRSISSKNALSLENIIFTKDSCQVKVKANPQRLPIWRTVLHNRYVDSIKSRKATTTWLDTTQQNDIISNLDITITPPFPQHLFKTFLQLCLSKKKLLTITVFYTTGTILIQGNTCQEWLDQEFKHLEYFVNYMCNDSSDDPGEIPNSSMDHSDPLPLCESDAHIPNILLSPTVITQTLLPITYPPQVDTEAVDGPTLLPGDQPPGEIFTVCPLSPTQVHQGPDSATPRPDEMTIGLTDYAELSPQQPEFSPQQPEPYKLATKVPSLTMPSNSTGHCEVSLPSSLPSHPQPSTTTEKTAQVRHFPLPLPLPHPGSAPPPVTPPTIP